MSTVRRDQLLALQTASQQKWADAKIYEVDAPPNASQIPNKNSQKFMVTFPYPYMNGFLHLGHAFSLSKAEFAAAYHSMKGKYVLFPFGFHCTGMPIQAAANKLKREMEKYGIPPQFPEEEPASTSTNANDKPGTEQAGGSRVKSKVAAKTGRAKFQWEILRQSGIDEALIPQFADAMKWLEFFPRQGVHDLQAFGIHTDWRRSFITTNVNPYYDSFIRWQFNLLKRKSKIKFGKRNTIYSPLDGQACADHDRSSGEGVGPQEYTLIKLEVIAPFPPALQALEGRKVYLAAATLRPETMYGQTNCWVQPDGDYGAFQVNEQGDIFVATDRSARNMCYQGLSPKHGEVTKVCALKGWDLIGLPLKAPNAILPVVHVLPLLTVSAAKGTGVVTSVPSDAPDDYRGLMDLKEKEALRKKYHVKDEWVMSLEPVPIIETPEYGNLAAIKACEQYKIKSQNDREALQQAKEDVYKKGFYGGIMLVGSQKGQPVERAKATVRDEMIAAGTAVMYSEPEKTVISRSGDECVVAFMDQWYLDYGEDEWKAQALKCLAKMETFHPETRRGFEGILGWLHEWACSRSFGLGTLLPWDQQFVIESLSDSTIYMAYYTVAHFLQGGVENLEGRHPGPLHIRPEQMTDEVWESIMLGSPVSDDHLASLQLDRAAVNKMRNEFVFWYPMDLRVSGKDLIGNHLTFSIYNHCAIFPEENWPLGFRANGHMLINAEKMSKNTGNFLLLREGIERYSSDGVRFAMADAGDTVEDANFALKTADDAVLKLTTFLSFVEDCLGLIKDMRSGPITEFADRVFAAQINMAVVNTEKAFDQMMFREALKSGFFELQMALGQYRVSVGADKATNTLVNMHKDCILKFIECQTLLIAPFCPHTCEHVWSLISPVIGKSGLVVKAPWPVSEAIDTHLLDSSAIFEDLVSRIRSSASSKKAKKKDAAPPTYTSVRIFICDEIPTWQAICLEVLKNEYDATTKSFPADLDKKIVSALPADLKKNIKKIMPFVGMVRDETLAKGASALDRSIKVDEKELISLNSKFIQTQLGLEPSILLVRQVSSDDPDFNVASDSLPTKPSFVLKE